MVNKETLDAGALLVRDMCSEDLTQVLTLEVNAHLSPWARLSFEASLTRQDECRVIDTDGQIIAYHICSTVLDELHVLNVVTAPAFQGVGLGHRLMHDILDRAQDINAKKIFLEVRDSNEIAQSLYRKWQFRQIAVRRNYYRVPHATPPVREDALVFVRNLTETSCLSEYDSH